MTVYPSPLPTRLPLPDSCRVRTRQPVECHLGVPAPHLVIYDQYTTRGARIFLLRPMDNRRHRLITRFKSYVTLSDVSLLDLMCSITWNALRNLSSACYLWGIKRAVNPPSSSPGLGSVAERDNPRDVVSGMKIALQRVIFRRSLRDNSS